MKHKHLTTAATAVLLLLVVLTWSCTTGDEPVPSPVTPASRELSISVGPRPVFTAGTTLPATRAVQTLDAAQWETGDVLWLYVCFSWTADGSAQPETRNYVSALRYNAGGWLPFSVQDSITLHTSGIKPSGNGPVPYSGFRRRPRWPAEALAGGTTGAEVRLEAYYLGKGTPVDGILSPDYTTDVMTGTGNSSSPGVPVTINLRRRHSRLHVTNGAMLTLHKIAYVNTWNLSSGVCGEADNCSVTVPAGGGYYFVRVDKESEILLDGNACTLAPGGVDGNGDGIYSGFTYTLVPLENGTVTPGDMKTDK